MLPQTAYTSRPLMDFHELEAIAHLLNTCWAADELESCTSATKLREEFSDPQFALRDDLRLWQDDSGTLVAMAKLYRFPPAETVDAFLNFDILPLWRGELEAAIFAWAEARLWAVGKSTNLPVVLQCFCRDALASKQAALAKYGFLPERSFLRLQRPLKDPIPEPHLPTGWQIRSARPDDADAWVEMFNQTFVDHWNHHPTTREEFLFRLTLVDYPLDLNLVVETNDDRLAAFCVSRINRDRNAQFNLREGHVTLLGTRRCYRRMGLARSLLLESLRKLLAAGMAVATIGVDSQNALGAVHLYTAVGFELNHRSTMFRKPVKL